MLLCPHLWMLRIGGDAGDMAISQIFPGRTQVRPQWTAGAMVGLVMALALIIRLFGIERESLWIDEAYSLWFVRQSYGDLVGDIALTEFNPPLYYILLHIWVDLFGESVFSIRLLSSLINVATIPFVYLTARWSVPDRHGHLTGMVAGTLFALCFAEIQYAQEARAYALLVLSFSVVTAASARIVRDIVSLTGPGKMPPASWPWLMLGLGAALTFWSHYTSLLLLIFTGLLHVAIWLLLARSRLDVLGLYLRSAAAFLVLAAPALWIFFAYAIPGSNEFWIHPPSLADAIDATSIIYGAAYSLDSWRLDLALRLLVFAPWPVLGLIYAWRSRDLQVRCNAGLMLALSIAAFALFLLVTYVARPVFLQRIVLPTQVGWIVLCAMAPLAFRTQRLRNGVAAGMVLVFSSGAVAYHVARPEITQKEPWREVARMIAQYSPDNSHVFTSASGEVIIGYYLERFGREDIRITAVSGSLRIPEVRRPFQPGADYYSPRLDPADAERMDAMMARADVSWLAVRKPEGNALDPFRAVFAKHGTDAPVCNHFMPGPVGVYRVPQRRLEPCGPAPRTRP